MNDIYQQLGAQLAQRGQQGQANPYASLMQQRQPQMQGGYGGGGGNPYAALLGRLGQPSASQSPYGGNIMQQLGQQLAMRQGVQPGSAMPARGAMSGGIPGYQMPAPDQRNQYASIPQAALDGTGWKNGINPQMFQQQNPYYGQTGYYGNLQQVQQQMAGKAQSAGIPQGVLGASTYTQNPAGQTPWTPDLTPQQKVDQDLASWEANRWNTK